MTVVELDHVCKSYRGPPPVDALRNVSLNIPAGVHTALMGPSGSGKSTLLNLIGVLDAPTSGILRVADQDVSLADASERAFFRKSHLGFVFQSFHLLPDRTVVENVELALRTADGRRKSHHRTTALAALDHVDLGHRWDAMPFHLSGGEQQRVAVARAVSKNPVLLVMDEPTGNLDDVSAGRILNIIETTVKAGLTVITATHDPRVAEKADRIAFLRSGEVVGE